MIGWIGAVSMLLGCTLALTLGGRQERVAATAYLLAWLFSTFVRFTLAGTVLESGLVLALDVTLLTIFAALVWKAPHNWLVWATAFQLLVATLQFLYLIEFAPPISAYFTIVNVSSLGIIVSMCVGTVAAWQERSVFASARDDLGRYS